MVRQWVPFQEPVTFRSLLLDYIDSAGGGLYWALNDTDLATDLSGNGHDGTAAGPTIGGHTATFAPITGEDASCTDLDGTDDKVTSSYSPFTNSTTRTYMGWAYWDVDNSADVLFAGSGDYPTTPILQRQPSTDDLFWFTASAGSGPSCGVASGAWYFWVFVFDENGNSGTFYINGSVISTEPYTDPYHASSGNFQIGAYDGSSNPFDGKMAHVAVVEGALSAQQIEDLYTASGN
jgi:hypothetical protein